MGWVTHSCAWLYKLGWNGFGDAVPFALKTSIHSALSRGGDPQAMLYPDQSLPPPVYTNLNKLTHAAQRKFSMSTNMASNTPDVDADVVTWQPIDEGDNLSIASAPHVQPEQKATNGGLYSVPGSPNRPSFSTSSSNSRPRGGSTGVEDPFSIEMDELDRMVTGECCVLQFYNCLYCGRFRAVVGALMPIKGHSVYFQIVMWTIISV